MDCFEECPAIIIINQAEVGDVDRDMLPRDEAASTSSTSGCVIS
ncbi:uncharacterized protein ARMOST_10289 [Armillaria ostoyae]|uniref:Uncharacterized protein n=1 Tax=Armillaria ostoyae TaxID=47428 RepID=A0A284RDW2_ARMOS|nr:uncharacterized protein ARMOST_10289 [Armillaria ostoyae]